MAKFELKFIDCFDDYSLQIKSDKLTEYDDDELTTDVKHVVLIEVTNIHDKSKIELFLDKSTSIKLAKTLRTEINKIRKGG